MSRLWTILAGADTKTCQEWGPLEADHSWHFEFKKRLEEEKDGVEAEGLAEYAEELQSE